MYWLWLLSVLTTIGFIYRHLTRNFNYWKNIGVPFLDPILIFGNVFKVATAEQSLGQFIQGVYNYTDSRFTGFFIFDQPFMLIRDPELIKSILVKDFEQFGNRSIAINDHNDKIGSKMMLSLKYTEWKQMRTKLTPLFTISKLKSMIPFLLEASNNLKFAVQNVIDTDKPIEIRVLSMKYAIDVITSFAFGVNSQSFELENAKLFIAARNLVTFNFSRAVQWTCYFIAPCLVKLFKMKLIEPKAGNFIQEVFWNQVHQRKIPHGIRNDLIDVLKQINEENNKDLDADIVAAQAIQFFIAGFESTRSTISFLLYELAIHKEVQNRLKNEIKWFLDTHGEITYKAISDMKYLDNAVNETLRKYPILSFLDRRCTKSYRIPNSDVTIEEGIPVYISLLGLHMDPAYFPDPDKFDPDRFSEENKHLITPFTYMPFGMGPKNCIAEKFGLLSVKSAIVTILSDYEIELDQKTPVPMHFDTRTAFIIVPKGDVIYLRFSQNV